MDIPTWLLKAREHAKLTQTQAGEVVGVTKGNWSAWENGRHSPSIQQLAKISRELGYALPPELSTMATEPAPSYGMSPIQSWEHEDDLPPGEFVFVPRLCIRLSAGHGREQIEIEFAKTQPQAFRADWIRKERLKPSKLAAMNAEGNSMEPSVFDGDSLVVDTSQSDVTDGRVYAIWYDGGERVKRLFRMPGGGLRIQSDNPAYPPIVLAPDDVEHVRVIGRVVHRSGKGGL